MATKMADEQPAEVTPEVQVAEQTPNENPAEEAPAEPAPDVEQKDTEESEANPPPPEEGAVDAPPTDETAPTGDTEAPPGEVPTEGETAPVASPSGEEEQTPAEGPAEGDVAPPADSDPQQAEGEGDAKNEGEAEAETPAADGAEAPAGDEPPVEGEEANADQTPAEGEAPATEAGVENADAEVPEGDEAPAAQAAEEEQQREGSPLVVGEQLSREASPQLGLDTERTMSPPVPGTPDRAQENIISDEPVVEVDIVKEGAGSLKEEDDEEEMEEEEEEEEEEEPEFDREQLIERYHQALAEREQQLQQNYQLQHKLAEHFRKKKSEETRQEVDKNITDSEQRYVKYMAQLDDLRAQDTDERETYKMQIEEMKERCQAKQALVEDEQSKFMEFQKQVALNSLNSRSGKPIAPKDIEQYLAVEARKEAEVVNVRLENIKLKNKLKKKEQQLKSKEELAEGLHLIDFEQLKIENQTYNEKIEERNEDLLKLRKKITSTVQVLTHLKEKLQFVHAENQVLKNRLHEVEDEAAKKRDKLTRTKQARDHLRIDNQRLRQNCGLLGNEPLLRDFEERKDESTDLRDKLEHLKMQHSELTLSCNGVRKKIEQARLGRI